MSSKSNSECKAPLAAAPEPETKRLAKEDAGWKRILQFASRCRLLITVLLILLLAVYINNRNQLDEARVERPTRRPDSLITYSEYRRRYPRNKDFKLKQTEVSFRSLLFIMDLISLGRHNFGFILGTYDYFIKQSPFKSDRTTNEQLDVMNQLDDFNLTQIMEMYGEQEIDTPVSGLVGANSNGANVELANPVNRWFTRLVNGDSYFEIPNYPLDQQPNPNKITHIDADLRDCTNDIQDQKACGACYAFSWNSYAQWHYCKQSGQMIDFSEQHIIDCGHFARLGACVSGLLPNVREFSHTFGFQLEKDYPYKAKQRECKKPNGDLAVRTIDFTRIKVDRDEWEEILKEQPILLEVHLPRDILSYKRGVHPGNNCDSSLAHGMILVGHGRQEGVPYWLLKNSMGKNWGENGYLRLSRDAPMSTCFRTGFITKFKFQSLDDDKYYDFYDNIKFRPTKQVEQRVLANKNMLDVLQMGDQKP